MWFSIRFLCHLFIIVILLFTRSVYADDVINIPILCYHNFNPTVPGSMSITPKRFEEQIKWLKDNKFTIIPLKEAVEYLQGKRNTLPSKAIVVTADDGWQSVYKYMYPIVKKYNFPVTLFIYPQTISASKNALTWEELKELQHTGLFDVQGHTYSHPNFKHAKKRLSPAAFEKLVKVELFDSKKILEEKMGTKIIFLAWPFGIYNDYLEQQAAKAGYVMAFTIDARDAHRGYPPMAQPRFMIVPTQNMKIFMAIANGVNNKTVATKAKKNLKITSR